MNKDELKIRKQWLAMLIIVPLWNFAFSLVNLPNYPVIGGMSDWVATCNKTFILFSPVVFNYIVYHCAYKKPGTKLLTVILILTPVSFALMIGVFVFGNVSLATDDLHGIQMVGSSMLSVWWYVLSWKMRTINRRFSQRVSTK